MLKCSTSEELQQNLSLALIQWVKFEGTKISYNVVPMLSQPGNEYFYFPLWGFSSNFVLSDERQTFFAVGHFPLCPKSETCLELSTMHCCRRLPLRSRFIVRKETAWSHSYEICFTFQDEVELQQDEENLPYEEEIYKDSSTFLKVSSFVIRRIGKGILLC